METANKIEYITDENGEKKVVIPASTYEEMLEDIQDLAAIAERKDEKTLPLEKVMNNLKRDGLL